MLLNSLMYTLYFYLFTHKLEVIHISTFFYETGERRGSKADIAHLPSDVRSMNPASARINNLLGKFHSIVSFFLLNHLFNLVVQILCLVFTKIIF